MTRVAAPSSDPRLPAGRPRLRPTMRDVADRAGTSIKSVSRALNGETGVSAATAERVLAVAADLGFRRNDLARHLRQGQRTGTVGLVLKRSSTRFYDSLIRGVEEVAEEQGALVITAGFRTPERERSTLLALSSRRVDGLLLVSGTDDHAFLRPEQAAGMPLVFVDRPPVGLVADAVLADDVGGGRAATEHLLRQGHRCIGVVGTSSRLHTVLERTAGHLAALAAAGLPAGDDLLALDRHGVADAQEGAAGLLALPTPPTALFALNTPCAIGAVRAVRAAGLQHRVAVVGFDDFELADLLDPPVTVVRHDVVEMGRVAARRLFARIDGLAGPPGTVVLPTTLLPRGSGEIQVAPASGTHEGAGERV